MDDLFSQDIHTCARKVSKWGTWSLYLWRNAFGNVEKRQHWNCVYWARLTPVSDIRLMVCTSDKLYIRDRDRESGMMTKSTMILSSWKQKRENEHNIIKVETARIYSYGKKILMCRFATNFWSLCRATTRLHGYLFLYIYVYDGNYTCDSRVGNPDW